MTSLSLAVRNLLLQDEDLLPHLLKYPTLGYGIFDTKPTGARFEGKGKSIIVVSEDGTWTTPNAHNTAKFPRIFVDIWSDPTRNTDGSMREDDADDKIEAIQFYIDRHLHLVDPGTPQGMPWNWGTAEQMAAKTGVWIVSSERRSGPDLSPISNTEGAFMGRLIYGVQRL